MTDKIENSLKEQVARFMPQAIEKALHSYHRFMDEDEPDTKKFKEHHLACKVAIAHVELLFKLARLADLPVGQSGEPAEDLSKMLKAASGDNSRHNNDYPDDEEEDLA